METLHTLARHQGPRGEVVLRRRTGDVDELIVNGVFAMDSAETFTEQQLAEVSLAGRRRPRVLVGGLGLGYTAAALLAGGVGRLDVVEIEECLVEWAHAGLTPTLAAVAADPRVHLHIADVGAVLAGRTGPAGPWDAIVLDVDNGPDFLIHEANAVLYAGPGLAAAYARLAPGGALAIWCQGPAPDLLAALRRISPTARAHAYRRQRQGRELGYVIYTVTRTGPEAQE
jgi:spermidine synthase